MHEMSIVEALLATLPEHLQTHPGTRIRLVRVRLGTLRQVVPATLKFCFAAATAGTLLAGARLELELVPAVAYCDQCRVDFVVEDNWFACPGCGSTSAALRTGRELELESLELVPAEEPTPAGPSQ